MKNVHKIIIAAVVVLAIGAIAVQDQYDVTTSSFSGSEVSLGAPGMPAAQVTTDSFKGSAEFGIVSDMRFAPEPPRGGDTAANVNQKMIKTGYLTLLVDQISEALPKINEIATAHNGFTENSNSGEYPSGERHGYLTIRVPSSNYDAAVFDIRELALKIVDESSSAQDVTEQYTDLETRLSVAQEEESAYLALLDRANDVSDLLQVQRELSNVRVRIESLQGQIKYLDNQTDLSTITITLEEETSINIPTKTFRFASTVREAFRGAVSVAQGLVTIVVWGVVVGVVIVLPLGLIFWAGRNLWNRRKK
ncbi:DUF4349 domain-containing protein [Candidatus Uhrbacteria bacterium]|jgi:hypothetical protein|nr:DUF4349 domain-containing protein [Candidatus Uhrbacteria bacterium]